MANDKVIIGVIQARMGSKRLPGKVLREINGKPMIWRICQRLRTVESLTNVVLAIPDNEENYPLRAAAHFMNINFVTGSEHDLISRIYDTAYIYGAEAIVRITGDCPLVDPSIVGELIKIYHMYKGFDYICNVHPRTFPKGLDVEIYSFEFLDRLNSEIEDSYYRESFPEYVWNLDNTEARKLNFYTEGKLSNLWWTVDYEEDLEFMENVYRKMGRDVFTMGDVFKELGEEAYYERELFDWRKGAFTGP